MSTPYASSTSAGPATGSQAPTQPGRAVPRPRHGSDPVMPASAEHVDARTSARLVVSRGAVAGTVFPVTGETTTIGRDDDCDLVINDITVSRYHAEIRRQGEHYTITDSGSLNGVYLNRRPVQHSQLSEADEIWIGKARFTFHLPTRSTDDHSSAAAEADAAEPSSAPAPQRTHLSP